MCIQNWTVKTKHFINENIQQTIDKKTKKIFPTKYMELKKESPADSKVTE